jgi:hypothetical protein
LQIVSLSFGRFPELEGLSILFKHSCLKLNLVLDIFIPENRELDFENIYKKIAGFLPNLQKHKCWANFLGGTVFNDGEKGLPFQSVGGITDLAHLIEHMIIDLQATVGQMKSCTGLTCGYQEPSNRFDLFIECKDKRVATFCSNLAVKMMRELVWKGDIPTRYSDSIRLARCLYEEPELYFSPQKLAQKLGWPKDDLSSQIKELISLKFLNKEFLLFNPGKRRGKK